MEIKEKKCQLLYKSESGARISVRLSLPCAEADCDLNKLYRLLTKEYTELARELINKAQGKNSYCLEVVYEAKEKEKRIIIKRVAVLKDGGKTVKSLKSSDVFNRADLKLKK